jgi:polyhydroxyalkanoate synthesis regulator phasin
MSCLLNRSGATGISLHASEKFDDQRRRHMIVGQAERNINDFMQTLGRAHRTGQVVAPRISLLMGDTPDEKRPAALLNNKMASLNANTTADKNAGFDTSQIPDFFNQYGDAVVEQVLSEYPEINEKLDFPITVSPDGIASLDDAEEGAIAKVTGRLPLLSVEEQESFYGILEEEYASFVNQQKALGNNVLEAEAVDLDARTLAQAEVIPAKAGMRSTFASGVSADVVDVKAQSKPKTQLEVINEVRTNLGLEAVDAVEDHDFEATDEQSQAYASSLLEKAGQAADKYLAQQRDKIERNIQDPEKRQTALNRESRRVGKQRDQLTQLKRFRVGQTVRLSTDQGRIFYGAVSGINKRGRSLDAMLQDAEPSKGGLGDTNPVAPSRWEVRVSLADSSREIPIPLSKVNTDRIGSVEMTPVQKTLMGEDDHGPI